jgi:adenosylmethionine---8-amino-7-oxononanoate aminotransferase
VQPFFCQESKFEDVSPAWLERLAFDRDHLWHPYTSTTAPLPVYPVTSASGVYIHLANGVKLIDGMSSWWAAIHGYNHPVLNQAAQEQLGKMSHVMFGGLTHEPAIELSRLLINVTPERLSRVFFSDSGSVAVEVALKMALQYWIARGETGRCSFLSLQHGYHGDTLHAMSVSDPNNGMHSIFANFLPVQHFISCYEDDRGVKKALKELSISDFEEKVVSLLKLHHKKIAAFIIEPLVQGAGGMRFYSPNLLQTIRKLCDSFGILLIADEIATGFGRTGTLFACEQAGVSPDLMCLGKALTGGYLTLGATLTSSEVASTICDGPTKVFMHGPTFMANPLACAISLASLELLLSTPYTAIVQSLNKIMTEELSKIKSHTMVKDVRVLGAIGVCETTQPINVAKAQQNFVKLGVWIRPFGHLLYIMPPFIITEEELRRLCKAIEYVLSEDVFG